MLTQRDAVGVLDGPAVAVCEVLGPGVGPADQVGDVAIRVGLTDCNTCSRDSHPCTALVVLTTNASLCYNDTAGGKGEERRGGNAPALSGSACV